MAERRLSRAEVGVVMTLKELGQTNVAIARTLGVSEGAIRYRLKREACGRDDGRSHRSSAVARYAEIIDWWVAENGTNRHRPTLKLLYERLVEHHGYELSYDALRRYVRRHYPEWLKKGARLRLETPPGKLAQVDWKEDLRVQIGGVGQWRTVHVLVVELSFSRKTVLWASEHKTLAALVSGQQMAWRTLGGMPDWVRPDCMKAAVKRWRGQHSILNDGYRRYMEGVGIGVFPARPGHGSDKGKVEKRIRDVLDRIEIERRVFVSLAQFQAHLERGVRALESEWRCGATGRTVAESFAYERKYLKPLPARWNGLL
jgi:transposase